MAGFDYTLQMIDRVTNPAGKAASAVDGLSKELDKAKSALSTYNRQAKLAEQTGDFKDFLLYRDAARQAAQGVYDAQKKIDQLPPSTDVASLGLAGLAKQARGLVGPFEAIVSVEAAVVGGFVAITVAGAAMAIEASESRDRLEALFDAMGDGPNAGAKTIAMLDDLSRGGLPGTRKELAETARAFEAMNISDLSVLRGQIVATESATAIMGKTGGEAYEKLIGKAQFAIDSNTAIKISGRQLSKTFRDVGVNVEDVAAQMGVTAHALTTGLKSGTVDAGKFANALREAVTNKGAGPLAAAGLEVGTVWRKGIAGITQDFEGLSGSVKPFAEELRGFFDIFDQANPSGQVLKSALGGAFTDIFSVAKDATHSATILFLTIELDSLKAYNAIYPVIHAVRQLNEALAEASIRAHGGSSVDVANFAATGDTAIKGAADATSVAGIAAKGTGEAIANGISLGMYSGLKTVYSAGAALADAAHRGATDKAEVHSPSRVMMRLGLNLSAGTAEGVERGTPDVRDAMGEMVRPPVAGRPGADGAPGQGGAGGNGGRGALAGGTYKIDVHVSGPAKAEEVADLAVAKLVDFLESIGLQMGGGQVTPS